MTKVCIDFETTGLPINGARPGIVQIAAKKFYIAENGGGIGGGNPVIEWVMGNEFNVMLDPELPPNEVWHPKAIAATGIGPEEVEGCATFFEALPAFAKFVLGCDTWVGYNTPFDIQILQMSLERYGFVTHFPWPYFQLDVMPMAKAAMNVTKGYTLSDAYEFVSGKTLDGAHDAMVDVTATIAILKGLEDGKFE